MRSFLTCIAGLQNILPSPLNLLRIRCRISIRPFEDRRPRAVGGRTLPLLIDASSILRNVVRHTHRRSNRAAIEVPEIFILAAMAFVIPRAVILDIHL